MPVHVQGEKETTKRIIQRSGHPSREKGRIGLFGICRRLIWASWLWLLIASIAISSSHWNMAILTLTWAALAYFVTPQEEGPKYGLDSKFSISSDKFLSSIVGTTGVPFVKGDRVSILNNGNEFYPTHRKSLIIDGRIVFTGGAGIADHWLGNAEDPKHWRDLQIRVEGPASIALQTGFAQNWLKTTTELISGPEYFPTLTTSNGVAVQTVLSSPEVGASALRIMYYLSIVCAQQKLYIANPYFIPDNAAIDILIEARKRGVDVKIMVAGIHNDMKLARYSSVHLYGKLLECGIEIYEYNRTMLHHKTMVADSAWITVGTTNFDNRSFALNEESNVCVYDPTLAGELEKIFKTDLAACNQVELETWKRRGLLTKMGGAASCFLKDQI
jgi:phosphatidylserine/phosphatidylglycerophosphate/cardiolipin synthase-like enzyme